MSCPNPSAVDWGNQQACKDTVRHLSDECARVRGLHEEHVRRAEKAEDRLDEIYQVLRRVYCELYLDPPIADVELRADLEKLLADAWRQQDDGR